MVTFKLPQTRKYNPQKYGKINSESMKKKYGCKPFDGRAVKTPSFMKNALSCYIQCPHINSGQNMEDPLKFCGYYFYLKKK